MNDKQFSTQEELINAIEKEWNGIPLNYIESLYKSLPNRIFQIICRNIVCFNYSAFIQMSQKYSYLSLKARIFLY